MKHTFFSFFSFLRSFFSLSLLLLLLFLSFSFGRLRRSDVSETELDMERERECLRFCLERSPRPFRSLFDKLDREVDRPLLCSLPSSLASLRRERDLDLDRLRLGLRERDRLRDLDRT